MVKNLYLIDNSTASPYVCPSIHPSGAGQPWYRNVLVQNRLGELTRLVPQRLGPNRLGAETTRCWNSVNRQNAGIRDVSALNRFGLTVSALFGGSYRPCVISAVGRFGLIIPRIRCMGVYYFQVVRYSDFVSAQYLEYELIECIRMENGI